jgi:hypothetical protein
VVRQAARDSVNQLREIYDTFWETSVELQDDPPLENLPDMDEPESAALPEAQLDDIVDRFIEFDIGRLRGEAGQKAQREFRDLGIEAIPALVRGLNKAASYQQSCPVCVISSKLENAMAQTSDPAMIRYALDNIGRGVPDDAPHADRVRAVRRQLAATQARRKETIRSDLSTRSMPTDQRMVDQVSQFDRSSEAALGAAICDPDARTRMAAVLALDRRSRYLEEGDLVCGRLLAAAAGDEDPTVQQAAREALQRLAGGIDLGNKPGAWKNHWDVVEQARHLKDAPAEELYRALDSDEWQIRQVATVYIGQSARRFDSGQRVQLAEQLINLLAKDRDQVQQGAANALVALAAAPVGQNDFGPPAIPNPDQPRTVNQWREAWQGFQSARVAEARAQSFLALGARFEMRGQRMQAAQYYQNVVMGFPQTQSAEEARLRLKAMRFR